MPFVANAAGLGKLTVISGLGEPLNAEIELLSTTPEELSTLSAAIAPEEAYAVQGLERDAVQSSIKVEVDKKSNGNPVLKLTTRQPVNDPFLDMLIQVDWATGRLLREYTVLLDPPGYSAKAANGVAAIAAPTVKSGSGWEAGATEGSVTPQSPSGKVKPAQAGEESPTASTTTRSTEEKSVAAKPKPEEYKTVPGDTLNSIAKRMQIDGVSLEQMLVGLYNANEDAFAGGNMNRLKVGKILRVPSPEELESVSQREAAKEVRVHTADWNAYRNKLAGMVAEAAPAAEDNNAQTTGGKISTAAEDKAAPPPAGPRDVVKLSKSDTGTAGDKSAQDRINALQEEVTAKEKAAQEANERTAMLEKQIADMQKLLAVKNQALAEMQKNATAGAPPAPGKQPEAAREAGKPAAPVQPPKPAEAPKPEAKAPAATAEAPQAAPTPAQPATQAAKPAAPTAKPRKRIVPPPPPPPEPGLFDDLMEDPTLIAAAGGGLVLLAGGWLFLRNRRRRNLDSFEQGILTAGGLKANTVFGNTAGGTVDTGDTSFLTDFSQSGGGMIDTHDVDPIAEAEVYMAYGRDAQAEEILKDAIAKEPQRYELHLKLLEILANRKDTAAFETIAGELYSTLGSGNPTWTKVAEMGHQLEPGNPLYDTKASGSGTAAAVAAGAVATAAAASNLEASDFENAEELNESSLNFSMDTAAQSEQPAVTPLEETSSLMDFDMGSVGNAEAEKPLSEMTTMSDSIFSATQPQPEEQSSQDAMEFTAPEVSSNEDMTAGLADFGTTVPGLEMPDLGTAAEPGANAAAEPQPAAVEDVGLNFEVPELKTTEAEETMEFTAPEEVPSFGQTLMMDTPVADNEISFEVPGTEASSLELPDLGEAAEPAMEEKPAEANGLDFSFDTMLETSEEISFESEEEETPNPPEIDLSGISLDFGPTIDNPEAHEEEITISSGAEAAMAAGESAEVETKLDLVTAYMEMGDKEGARELLDEVMKEGGPQQKERAQQMINEMG